MVSPEISVVIPTRNRGQLLSQTIRSLFAQHIPLEVIVARAADDTEAPNIPESSDERVRLVQSKDAVRTGPLINFGYQSVQSPRIFIFADDDLVMPKTLSTLLNIAIKEEADLVGGISIGISSDTKLESLANLRPPNRPRIQPFRWRYVYGPFLKLPMPGNTLYSADLVMAIPWNEKHPVHVDKYFSIESCALARKPLITNVAVRGYRSHPSQLSKQFDPEIYLDEDKQWIKWVLEHYPQSLRYARQRKAEELLCNAFVAHQRDQISEYGKLTLKIPFHTPEVLTESKWWRMVGHFILTEVTRVQLGRHDDQSE